uniref:Uncharacterized protein n=1 Tax=Chelydra serpentina TaxID=8475 RepID=A0A8C3T7V3_CHESE
LAASLALRPKWVVWRGQLAKWSCRRLLNPSSQSQHQSPEPGFPRLLSLARSDGERNTLDWVWLSESRVVSPCSERLGEGCCSNGGRL